MTDAIMRAAEARAAGVTQRSHRPTQRRSSQEEGPNAGRVGQWWWGGCGGLCENCIVDVSIFILVFVVV